MEWLNSSRYDKDALFRNIFNPLIIANKQNNIPDSIHQNPAFFRSSRFRIDPNISNTNPMDIRAIGK